MRDRIIINSMTLDSLSVSWQGSDYRTFKTERKYMQAKYVIIYVLQFSRVTILSETTNHLLLIYYGSKEGAKLYSILYSRRCCVGILKVVSTCDGYFK